MKKVLVINSAKGGVGKTETTIGIATELQKRGELVAVLDLDITTPNIGTIEGVKVYAAGRNTTLDKKQIKSLIRESANDFKNGWLLIDTPPTISSLYSAITETIRNAKFLFVTTPSKNAVLDTGVGIKFFAQRGVVPVGIIQNMVGGVFGELFDSISTFGVQTIGSIPLTDDTSVYFPNIVDKLDEINFEEVVIEPDVMPILSKLTVEDVEEDRKIPLRFYNLETWDIIRERLVEEDLMRERFIETNQSINSHFDISTGDLRKILEKGSSATIMIKGNLSVQNAPLPYEVQNAEIVYDNNLSKGLPMFKLKNGVLLWAHECILIEDQDVIGIMDAGGIDMGEGRIIQSLYSQMYYNRAFNRDPSIGEPSLIKRHIEETGVIPEAKQIIYSVYSLEGDGEEKYEDFDMKKYIESQKESFPTHYDYLNSLVDLRDEFLI